MLRSQQKILQQHKSGNFEVFQGGESAPAIWLVVSLVLIQAFDNKSQNKGIPDPEKKAYVQK